MIDILSFGAGVQSTTLLCMSCDGVLPKLDAAIFADTHAEPSSVRLHLEWCQEKAGRAGIKLITTTKGDLRADLIAKLRDGKRAASLPLYVLKEDGTSGLLPRQCTQEYKIEPVDKAIRSILGIPRKRPWPTVVPIVRLWMGISADEVQRTRRSDRLAIQFWYPLLSELSKKVPSELYERGFTRQDCLAWMEEHGYPTPPRSACTFCPFHSDAEWLRLQTEDPESFADAVEVDRLIRSGPTRELRGKPYLHSSLIPLEMVKFDKNTTDPDRKLGMVAECLGMCGV